MIRAMVMPSCFAKGYGIGMNPEEKPVIPEAAGHFESFSIPAHVDASDGLQGLGAATVRRLAGRGTPPHLPQPRHRVQHATGWQTAESGWRWSKRLERRIRRWNAYRKWRDRAQPSLATTHNLHVVTQEVLLWISL